MRLLNNTLCQLEENSNTYTLDAAWLSSWSPISFFFFFGFRFCACQCIRRLGRWAIWVAYTTASYIRTSTVFDSTLLSACLRISSDQNTRMWLRCAVISSGAHVTVLRLAMLAELVKHLWNKLLMVSLQSKQMQRCTPLNQAAAMLKLSGQSDLTRRDMWGTHTQTDRETAIPCFYWEISTFQF